jgi:invasion protein IalB
MSNFPPLHELVWLFESDPEVEDEDLGWPTSGATFRTTRGSWGVECTIEPYDHSVTVLCSLDDQDAVRLSFRQNVDMVTVDRTHDIEALVITFQPSALLWPVRFQLKPHVRIRVGNRLSWERA